MLYGYGIGGAPIGVVAIGATLFLAPATTEAPTQTYGGAGWAAYYLPRRTQEEIDEERYRLGIIPRPAAAAVRKVAKKIVKQAKESDVDPLEYLRETHARQQAFLASELRAREQTARLAYMQLLALEIELMVQAQEDEDIINLLFEM